MNYKSSTALPLNRVFDKLQEVIHKEWNENPLKIMKVPQNSVVPPVVWSVAQENDNSEALNSNMNSKCDFIFIFVNDLHRC